MQFDEQQLKQVLTAIFDERGKLDTEQHQKHHAFIDVLIEREQKKSQLWENIKTQVLGWGIIGVAGGLGAWLANRLGWHG